MAPTARAELSPQHQGIAEALARALVRELRAETTVQDESPADRGDDRRAHDRDVYAPPSVQHSP